MKQFGDWLSEELERTKCLNVGYVRQERIRILRRVIVNYNRMVKGKRERYDDGEA